MAPSGLDEIQKTQPKYGRPNIILTIILSSKRIWWWGWIHLKVDFISFSWSTWTPQMEYGWSRGRRYKLVLSCCPKPVHAKPLPFLSSPSFLSKTRVHAFPLYKYNGHEVKNELTWWLSWRARARVMGPSGGSAGVDVSLVLMSSSLKTNLARIFMFGY